MICFFFKDIGIPAKANSNMSLLAKLSQRYCKQSSLSETPTDHASQKKFVGLEK
jgi:hypothetical protein